MSNIVLSGFLLVALPLSLAVVLGIVYVDRLSSQSEILVTRGIEVSRQSQRLKEHVVALERIARKYQVLGDVSMIRLYEERHGQYLGVLSNLERFRLQGVADWNLEQLRNDSEQVLRMMLDMPPDSETYDTVLANFSRMADLTSGISREGNEFIDKELAAVRQTAESARRYLSWSVLAVLPGVAVLIVLLTFLFTRPLRLLSGAIAELGAGRFEQPIRIGGPPAEMEQLGARLDWLRIQLRTLDEEKALFLRHVSHELKTPLASIREATELLHDGMLGELSPRQLEVLSLLRENGVELEHLVENLLLLNAWQEGSAKPDYQMVHMCEMIRDILNRYRVTLDRHGLLVDVRCDGVKLLADPLRLRMMINNLVSNAVKYSPPGGRIDIIANAQRGQITLDVRDEGPGVPEDERELVLKPFFQGANKPRGYVRGTGIGLSVVQETVAAHHGQLSLLRSHRGAHFRIRLPAMPPQKESAV